MAIDEFTKSQMDRADKANAALCLALEMLAYIISEWEHGTPCYEATEGVLHEDSPIGNALHLGDEQDAINDMLEAFFPPQNLKHIDPTTWGGRVETLKG